MRLRITLLLSLLALTPPARAEVVWFPQPPEAFSFGSRYPEAQRLLFAFDYGHALVYERLLRLRDTTYDPGELERRILADVFAILANPPNVKVDEEDIAPGYVYKFPLTVNLFDWSHMLHQWILDVMATSEDRGEGMARRIGDLMAQYRVNEPVAITDVCKTMQFMDGHYFSKAFRREFPSFNLLIWSYHWFQIKLYEALMEQDQASRDREVARTTVRFRELVSDLPDSAEFDMMPETPVEAPRFARMVPKIADAFDNNHMLHDVVSDLLVSDRVATPDLRREGLRVSRMALDPNAFRSSRCPQ